MNLVLQIWPKCVEGGRGVKIAGKSAYVLIGRPLMGVGCGLELFSIIEYNSNSFLPFLNME